MQSKSHAGRSEIVKDNIEDDDHELEDVGGDSEDGADEPELDENSSEFSAESIEVWRSSKRRLVPYFYFSPAALNAKDHKLRNVGKKYCMTFRMVNECKIVRQIFQSHGFKESHPGDYDFNLMWTGKHLKAEVVRNFYKHQRINHFPRTYELTRKDRLYKNVQKMQETKGFRNFDIVPTTFLIPQEFASFSSYFCREGGLWIVKPVASSRGRGIFLVSHPDQVPTDESFVVSRYITNPLLIDGYKFDIRLYVVVTSFDPLVIYLYEEGLTRFATVKFDKTSRHIGNHFMHLTNYSVNKKSLSFVQNSDSDVEDQGSKWTLGALLRRLRSQGKDVVALMMKIEDAIVKTIISAEASISAACRMYVPYKENCFEIFGFDVIVDENMKPWVLEVNLSPSLACDSPLDMKVKSHMICDMFNLVGLPCSDEVLNTVSVKPKSASASNQNSQSKMTSLAQRPHSGIKLLRSSRIRPSSAAVSSTGSSGSAPSTPLTTEERQSIRRIREEAKRAGGFIRLFPTEDSWELYGNFFDSHASFNGVVHEALFGPRNRAESMSNYSVLVLRQNTLQVQSTAIATAISSLQRAASLNGSGSAATAFVRSRRYERSLPRNGGRVRSPPRNGAKSAKHQARAVSAKVNSANESSKTSNVVVVAPQQQHIQFPPQLSRSKTSDDQEMFNLQVTSPRTKPNEEKASSLSSAMNSPRQAPQTTAPPQAQPAPPPIATPNLIADIENGYSLTVTQARSAFTRYLELVRARLLTPIGSNSTTQELQDAELQNLDLVVRFMRRAAVNLSENVKISPPSKRFGLEDQRNFVANQMTDFLRVYKKDTYLLPNDDFNSVPNSSRSQQIGSSNAIVEPARLQEYLSLVSESELEKFLTHYTKVKKSAAIFLGSPLSNSAANAKANRPATAISVSNPTSRPGTAIGDAAQQNYASYNNGSQVVWSPTNGHHYDANDEPQLVSPPEMALPEGIVLRSDLNSNGHHSSKQNHNGNKPPAVPNSGRSTTSNRPMSSASTAGQGPTSTSTTNGKSAYNSSLAAAVAVYSAPVKPPPPTSSSSNGTANSKGNAVVPSAKPPADNQPALATSAYLRWSSSTKGSLANSCSDAILNAALQRIALKYSSPSKASAGNLGGDSRRLSHSGSLTSLASNPGAAAPVQFSVADGANSRASSVYVQQQNGSAYSTTNGGNSLSHQHPQQPQQQQQVSAKLRPQSASVSITSTANRPPLPR